MRAQRTAILNDPVSITTPGTMVVGTAVNAANTDYFSEIEGTFQVTATGSVKIQFRSEVATNTTTVQTGSYLSISPLTSIPNVGSSGLGTENYVSKFDALG